MKLIIAILLLISMAGCKSQSIELVNCNLRLREDVKKNWILSSDSSFHISNNSLFSRMDTMYKLCILNFNTNNINEIFGIPNEIKQDEKGKLYKYYTSPPCNKSFYQCSYLLFQFNTTNSFISFQALIEDPGFPK